MQLFEFATSRFNHSSGLKYLVVAATEKLALLKLKELYPHLEFDMVRIWGKIGERVYVG